MSDTSLTIVATVPNIAARDKLIKQIQTNLTKEPSTQFTVIKDQVNRVKVFHNVSSDIRVLIRTYLVIVIPVMVDLSSLNSLYGNLDFHLEDTIKQLSVLIGRLKSMQGKRFVKPRTNNDFESLLKCLSN